MIKAEEIRHDWVKSELGKLKPGSSILDVGAGECRYKYYASHLEYVSQDVAEYDGSGDNKALQTKCFDFSQIDIRCDLLDIPEDNAFDTVLFTEILEHVPDPVAALRKLAALLKPNGCLIATAPFASLTHFSPYFYCTGFSRYFFEYHLPKLGFKNINLISNGNYFQVTAHEIGRYPRVYKQYFNISLGPLHRSLIQILRGLQRRHAQRNEANSSAELLTNGFLVTATLSSDE